MASFESIRPSLDAMSIDELVSAGEYISQRLEKQLSSSADNTPTDTIEGAEADTTVTSKPFPLLQLPRELRDEILFYAVQSSSAHSTVHDGSKIYKQASIPALLHTNRQLRAEAAEPFFSQHTFVFWGDARFGRLAKLLSISGNTWNKFVKCVVLIPDESHIRESPWDVYDALWAAKVSRDRRAEAELGRDVVWTAMRKVGFGNELRYGVMGESAITEDDVPIEMVIG